MRRVYLSSLAAVLLLAGIAAPRVSAFGSLFRKRRSRPSKPPPGLAPQESLRPYTGRTPEEIFARIEADVYKTRGVSEGASVRDKRSANRIVQQRYDAVLDRLQGYRNLPIPRIRLWRLRQDRGDLSPRGTHLSDARRSAAPLPIGPRLEIQARNAMRRYIGEPPPLELTNADMDLLEDIVRKKILIEENISRFSPPADVSRAEALVQGRVDRELRNGNALNLLGK